MKLSINAIYNLGRAEKGAEKLFMSGQAILDAFRTGAYTKLSNGQKAKLRKIANRLNKEYM